MRAASPAWPRLIIITLSSNGLSCRLLYGFGLRGKTRENVRCTETPVSALIGSPYRRLKY